MKSEIHPLRLLAKALLLFIIINIGFAVVDPAVHKLSAYNTLFAGRVRFPFGGDIGIYDVMVDDLDVMVASHEISAPKAKDEFRVVIIGDSSVWGEGAAALETISVQWNKPGYLCGNKKMKFYNLAYPHPSVVKDLIILDEAMEHEPDAIVWFMTLNTLTQRRLSPFVKANPSSAVEIMDEYAIPYNPKEIESSSDLVAFYEKTLLGRRSESARMLKLQALGLLWTVTGADTTTSISQPVDLPEDVTKDRDYKVFTNEAELAEGMTLDSLMIGHEIANPFPILLVNEPMFIATGLNSSIRYNDGYPRWAYDYYRSAMTSESQKNQWHYLDLWDSIPNEYFFDTVLHISPEGQRLMIQKINPVLQSIACR